MKYVLSKEFTKISETSGTIQNASKFSTIEVSNQAVKDSGLLLFPTRHFTFNGATLYARCISGGGAAIRVVPFFVNGGGSSSSSEPSDPTDETDANSVVNTMWASDDFVDDADVTIQQIWDSDDSGETGDGFSDDLQAMFG